MIRQHSSGMSGSVQRIRQPVGRIERSLRGARARLLRAIGVKEFTVTAAGLKFVVGHDDLIDQRIAHEGFWEAEQFDFIAGKIGERRFDVFLDIGANCGFYSMVAARNKLAGEVIAFEPDPGNRARLLRNLEINALADDIWVLAYALGDRSGEVALTEGSLWNRGESYLAHDKMPAGEKTHQVRTVRFDDEFKIKGKRVYVKMDVEGYEFHVIDGMERTLKENPGFLQIEIFADDPEKLKQRVTRLGYRYLGQVEFDHFFTNIEGIE
jgi:FkbM family methyltransferase